MDREALYNELIQSEPLGFIDPFSDIGEFDPLQMKFKQPVKDLVNRYSGQPYSLAWQHKITGNAEVVYCLSDSIK